MTTENSGNARQTVREEAKRLPFVALAAAGVSGSVVAIRWAARDGNWPARGGIGGLFFDFLAFSVYSFPICLGAGAILLVTAQPLMRRMGLSGAPVYGAVGLLVGVLVHWLVNLVIGEPNSSPDGLFAGTAAGLVAGLLWWFTVQRHERQL